MIIKNRHEVGKFYKALINRDEKFVGIFYVGVKTTGVFCLPICRARKPKLDNVEFFTNLKEVLQSGYRPCKICNPTENAYEPPTDVVKAISLIKQKEKTTDYQLRKNDLRPELIRRWFKKHYGLTFHTYQRMIRVNNAFQELKNGNSVTDSAFSSSYESLSGFGYTYKKLLGIAPQNSSYKNVILISRITTPLGPMFACATDKGLCLLEFVDRRMLETEFRDLQRLMNAKIILGENEHILKTKTELSEYFNGSRKIFTMNLDTPGTNFQKSVWNALQKIPFGSTRSYQEQAEKLNQPKAVRAVASANGRNRISIVIPCHRVIGKNGTLVGYGGGIERKKWLLEHEKKVLNSTTKN